MDASSKQLKVRKDKVDNKQAPLPFGKHTTLYTNLYMTAKLFTNFFKLTNLYMFANLVTILVIFANSSMVGNFMTNLPNLLFD